MIRILVVSLFVCASGLKITASKPAHPEKFDNPLFDSYEDYVNSQNSKTSQLLDGCREGVVKKAVNPEDMKYLAKYMKEELHLPFTNKFALTHGTRCGYEQQYFINALKEQGEKVSVLGTEISPNAKDFPYTIVWDFHEVKPEWEGKADFVYSNALDHSYNPKYAVQQWMKEVSPKGALVLEHNKWHKQRNGKIDIFRAKLEEYEQLIKSAGNFKITKVLENPMHVNTDHAKYIIVQHA